MLCWVSVQDPHSCPEPANPQWGPPAWPPQTSSPPGPISSCGWKALAGILPLAPGLMGGWCQCPGATVVTPHKWGSENSNKEAPLVTEAVFSLLMSLFLQGYKVLD